MNELTIRGARAQQNLLEWSRRVAECRSSGQAVSRWCGEHGIKPKTYYNWQKKVFAA
jgi:transposase-like protein